jgi:poly(hydroxyalkanoate) depolymerase family esterase
MKLNHKMLAMMRQMAQLIQGGRKFGPPGLRRPVQTAKPASAATAKPPVVEAAPVVKEKPDPAPMPHAIPVSIPELLAGWRLPSLFDQLELPLAPPHSAEVHEPEVGEGQFSSASYSNEAGTRDYKLYLPRGYRKGEALPLLVMLHGCSQNPDDFAAGTRMNVLADERQFIVVYPAQTISANGSRCWNWFQTDDQKRDGGEPSIIAGITREVIENYSVDPRQVYVAGLSAGGAMAVILGSAYPDLYAAVGVHSGLPYAAAKDLSSALAAMHGRASEVALAKTRRTGRSKPPVPVIVFHGDRDTTVHPNNGDLIVTQSVRAPKKSAPANVEEGQVPNGHSYTRTTHVDAAGQPIAEQWLVHGAGHAWSGGSEDGSYTDAKGPDASQEMMRFFATHSRPPVEQVRTGS